MIRSAAGRLVPFFRQAVTNNFARTTVAHNSSKQKEGDEESFWHTDQVAADELDVKFIEYFDRPNITGWELRKAMQDLYSEDLIPEPSVLAAALRACRRINDFSLAVRTLEMAKNKCGNREKEVWPYLLKELDPTLKELGVSTPEELGYDKPELALKSVYDMH